MPCAKKIKNVKTFFFSFNLIIFYLFVIAHIYLLFFPFYNYLGVLAAIIPVFGHICALLYDDLVLKKYLFLLLMIQMLNIN